MIRKTIAVAMVVAMCATALSQTTDKGKKLIGKYPAADRDRDGVLSEQELLDLKKSVRKSGGVSAPGKNAPAEAPATRPTKEQKAEKRLAKLRVPMTFTDVAYGPLERNRLDFWKAESKGPTPVMVLIHAGGFTGGDKSFWYSHPLLSQCHEHGISVAAINYRLIKTERYPAPMHDGARAVQFLRSQAAEWNIDPRRIAAAGGSAGACIAVWLGTHDDLADSSNLDPIAQQSTRLSFVVSYDGQTSLDPDAIVKINPRARTHPWFHLLFGASSPADFDKPEVRQLINDATATNLVSKDDPPVFMNYQADLTAIPLPPGEQNMHHPYFGVMLKEKMDSLGLESVLHYRSKPPQPGEDVEFILQHFGLKKAAE
jgi:acetyl esterase